MVGVRALAMLSIDVPKYVDDLLSVNRTLGSFSDKLKIAYALGWIGKETYEDCRAIHGIRNEMAHNLNVDSFDHHKVKVKLDALHRRISRQSGQPNQLFIRTILPFTEPVTKNSMACLASRSAKVWVTSGSIFFSARRTKILGRSSRNGFGSFRSRVAVSAMQDWAEHVSRRCGPAAGGGGIPGGMPPSHLRISFSSRRSALQACFRPRYIVLAWPFDSRRSGSNNAGRPRESSGASAQRACWTT